MQLWFIGSMIGIWLISAPAYAQKSPQKQKTVRREIIKPICLNPIGVVKKQDEHVYLEVYPEYAPGLHGLQDFSHLWVFYWFHENDNSEERRTLKVHPRRDPSNPLTGVFACRAPVRPNLIGFSACRIIQVNGNVVEVADLDARDGSPIVDLKPYIPQGDAIPEAQTPKWLKRSKTPTD